MDFKDGLKEGGDLVDFKDGVIEEWSIIGECIWGYLYHDSKSRFEDGTFIKTSSILYGEQMETGVIKTKNSTYLLGKKYEEVGDEY